MDIEGWLEAGYEKFSGIDWRISAFIVTTLLSYRLISSAIKEQDSLNDTIRWVRRGTFGELYQRLLLQVLNYSDTKLLEKKEHLTLPATSWRRAWTVRLFDLTLLMSLTYSILFPFIQWSITFDGIRYGGGQLLDGESVFLMGGTYFDRISALVLGYLLVAICISIYFVKKIQWRAAFRRRGIGRNGLNAVIRRLQSGKVAPKSV